LIHRISTIFCLVIFAVSIFLPQVEANENKFIDEFEIFHYPTKVSVSKKIILGVRIKINKKFHINSNAPKDEYLIPSKIEILNETIKKIEYDYPAPSTFKSSYSESGLSVFSDEIFIFSSIQFDSKKIINNALIELLIAFKFQACDDFSCYPPAEIKNKIKIEVEPEEKNFSEKNVYPEWLKKSSFDLKIKIEEEDKKKIEKDGNKKPDFKPIETGKKIDTSIIQTNLKYETAASAAETGVIVFKTDASEKNNTDGAVPTNLILIMLYAFLGGIILNVMPCVLPVLSIKILGLVKQKSLTRKQIATTNLFFVFGILCSFLIIALAIIIIKISGGYAGWGFQFQNSGFIIFISAILLIAALNLFGVFEIAVAGSDRIENLKSKYANVYISKFLEGILAVLLATPCSAPFLGTALGFAFSQNYYMIILMFLLIGIGMSVPYIVAAFYPGFVRVLPKSGGWMIVFKQFLGFPLILTVVWLLYILQKLSGDAALFDVIIYLIIVSFCCWIYGKILYWNKPKKFFAYFILAAILISGFNYFAYPHLAPKNNKSVVSETNEMIKYSKTKFDNYMKTDKTIFLEFTAEWCLTCQLNKKNVIETEEIRNFFRLYNVVHLRADWTDGDKEVSEALEKFKRSSVPLYVVIPADKSKSYIILPELLTAEILRKNIRK